MSIRSLLILGGLLAIGACHSATGPATDCVYDKTASAAPGNEICTPSPVITSQGQTASQP